MYLTIKETAEFLSISVVQIENMVRQKKIRAIHDGEQYLIYKEQFNTHLQQMEKYKKVVAEALNEPIPDDIDIKDED